MGAATNSPADPQKTKRKPQVLLNELLSYDKADVVGQRGLSRRGDHYDEFWWKVTAFVDSIRKDPKLRREFDGLLSLTWDFHKEPGFRDCIKEAKKHPDTCKWIEDLTKYRKAHEGDLSEGWFERHVAEWVRAAMLSHHRILHGRLSFPGLPDGLKRRKDCLENWVNSEYLHITGCDDVLKLTWLYVACGRGNHADEMVRPEDQAIIQYFKNEAGLFRDRRNSADLYDNEEKAYNVAVRSAREVWNVLSQQSEEQEAIPGTQGISSSGGSDPGKGKGVTRMASEAIFFKGQVFDATKSVAVILAQANESIVIVDGYISEKVLDMLTCKPKTASVKILTKDKSISPVFKRLAADFIKQYGNLEIRTSEAFHDRFIIVDDRDFYHLGASIKDAGKKGSMLSHIEQPSVIHDIRVNWAKEWASAKVEL